MTFVPCLIRSSTAAGESRFVLGDPLVDRYLEFVAGRSRPNTLLAVAFDLKTFFCVVDKDPVDVEAADVFKFLAHQRTQRSSAAEEIGRFVGTSVRRYFAPGGTVALAESRGGR